MVRCFGEYRKFQWQWLNFDTGLTMRGYVKAALILLATALISPPLSVRTLALGDISTSAGP